jgi:uncharacterized protein (TIGR02246 family)
MERPMIGSDWRALEGLLTDFAWHADRGEGDALAALFLPEATLVVGGQEHRGRAQIAADCHRRASDLTRKVRHVWSNLRVLAEEEGQVRTVAIQLTYEQSSKQAGTQLRLNDLHDLFARGADGKWQFAERTIARAMALDL